MTDSKRDRMRFGEAWLEGNRRALVMGMIPPGLVALATTIALVWSVMAGFGYLGILFLVLTVAALWMIGHLLFAYTQPRIGYHAGNLLVYLEPARPTRVPIDVVECFFLGQGPSDLPQLAGREPETQNVIVRLAEAATEWKHRDVKPAFGHWCEGYITIRGTWCEPITPELMKRMNARLAEIHRERKAARQEEAAK